MVFGTGTGLGMAYSNCQNEFSQPFIPKGEVVKVTDPKLIEQLTKKN